MAVEGITKLPITVKLEEATKLFMKLSNISGEVGRLDEKYKSSMLQSGFINLLALNESVQSTRIEGTQVTFTGMIEQSNTTDKNSEYIEVMNYQKALKVGEERIKNGYPITTRLILELHSILMDGARGSNLSPGDFRKIENWIGPTKKREDAVYIPIAANKIEEFLSNWENYANGMPYGGKMSHDHLTPEGAIVLDEDTHPLLKIGILHAQFESIHPFLDGNGRLGRILIALYMMQTNQISAPLFFVSEELETKRAKYYDLLNKTRGDKPNWYSWLNFFLEASERMSNRLNKLLDDANLMAVNGIKKCRTTTEKHVYLHTFSNPNATAPKVAKALRISPTTARRALNSLVEYELIYRDNSMVRNIQYFNYDVLELITKK